MMTMVWTELDVRYSVLKELELQVLMLDADLHII